MHANKLPKDRENDVLLCEIYMLHGEMFVTHRGRAGGGGSRKYAVAKIEVTIKYLPPSMLSLPNNCTPTNEIVEHKTQQP